MKILIKNIRIIQENSLLSNHQVVIEDGKISSIIPMTETLVSVDKVIDGGNMYLAPGFIDIHNHGNSSYDTMDATPKALEEMAKYHLSNGVTSFCATTMTNPTQSIKDALANVNECIKTQDEKSSRLLGVYLEGPYFNQIKKGAQPGKDIKDPNLDELKDFIKTSGNHILVVSLAPELPGTEEMVKYCVKNGITVALGHTNSDYEDAQKAIDLGATLCTHLYNGMRSYTHREPGVIGACLTNPTLRTELICDGIHLHKTAVEVAKLCKTSKNIVLISDAMRAAGLPDGASELGGQTVIVENGAARLTDGSLAGSTLNLNLAVKNMLNLYNTSILDAVNMATINPARAIGKEDIIGSIEEGKIADLLLFDENVDIKHIIKGGILLK